MEATALVRPQPAQGRGLLGIGFILAAVVLATGAAVFFFLMPRTGTLVVNAVDAKGGSVDRVDVFVDGKKECETTPCTLKRDNGSHVVKVVAVGFDTPEPKTIEVKAGQQHKVDFSLVGGKGAGSKGGTGVSAQSRTNGLQLYVDGDLIGTLPQDATNLTPGEHKIKITGGERYATLEKTITVNKGEVTDLGNIALKVLKGKATVDLATPGAKVFIVSGTDRRELPRLPLSVELDPAKAWTLEATKAGMNDFRMPIVFEDGQAEKNFTITLDPKGTPAPATATPVNPTPANPTPANPTPVTPPTPKASTEPVTPPPAKTADPGGTGQATLNINSIPASNAVLDGKPLGPTPKMGVSVSAGAHTVTFINSDQNLKKTVSVTVKAGETKAVSAKLRD